MARMCGYCNRPMGRSQWEVPSMNGVYCRRHALELCGPREKPRPASRQTERGDFLSWGVGSRQGVPLTAFARVSSGRQPQKKEVNRASRSTACPFTFLKPQTNQKEASRKLDFLLAFSLNFGALGLEPRVTPTPWAHVSQLHYAPKRDLDVSFFSKGSFAPCTHFNSLAGA